MQNSYRKVALDNGSWSLGQYLLLIYGGLRNEYIYIAVELEKLSINKCN